MESTSSVYNLSGHSDNLHKSSAEGGLRKSASQAYFDRYPERKGRGPYIPSPSLTRSVQSDLTGKESGSHRRAGSKSKLSGLDYKECRTLEMERISDKNSSASLQSKERRDGFRAYTHEGGLAPPVYGNNTSSTYSSSSSVSSSGVASMGGSHKMDDEEWIATGGYSVTANLAGGENLQPNLTPQHHSGSRNVECVSKHQGPIEQQSARGGKVQEYPSLELPNIPSRRRLKAQQSLPDVRTSKVKKSAFNTSDMPRLPWSGILAVGTRTGSESEHQRSTSQNISNSSSGRLSIDDILQRHKAIVFPARGHGSYSNGKSSLEVDRAANGKHKQFSKGEEVTEDDSDTSLDSIEEEIRCSMRMTDLSHELVDKDATVRSNESKDAVSASPSTPTLSGIKKSSPSILNPARRLRTLSTALTSSPSSNETSSPSFLRQTVKKKKTLSVAVSPNTPGISSTPSPTLQSPTASALVNEQEEEIRTYVQSTRLTMLMTLNRTPFSGLTVSIADVGHPEGHPVFVFLGLGAVRYLVGLYDEMATVLKLRLICIDRWGLGKTDDLPAERRGVLEWSNVVSEVADRLQLEQFSILAHSAGAPYAMATCLMHESRIAGPLHLLAPWVGSTIESGYKWLKYIPDGVIKSAQAADWKMQAWKLGLGKTPLLVHPDETSQSNADGNVFAKGRRGRDNGSLSPSISQTSFDSALLTPTLKQGTLRPSRSGIMRLESSSSSSSIPSLSNSEEGSWSVATDPYTMTHSDSSPTTSAPPLVSSRLYGSLSSNSAALHRPHLERSTSSPLVALPEPSQARNSYNSNLTHALLRASHSENLRGGGTNDLLVILGRSSQKPWGFTYTDIKHSVIVWQGDKDERISLSSIMWMEREMKNCTVNIIKGASHGLMTNVAVVVEALESISKYR